MFARQQNLPHNTQQQRGSDQKICDGQKIVLNAFSIGASYLWQDGTTSQDYVVSRQGNYFVEVNNNCGSSADSINIIDANCDIFIPNAFSPNEDRKNDVFRISGGNDIREFSIKIYDRWGSLVYASDNALEGWRGICSNKKCEIGMYVYLVQFKKVADPSTRLLKGTVLLVR